MGEPSRELPGNRSHQEIIKDKENKLAELRVKTERDPSSLWQEFKPVPELTVTIPSSALIEIDAMIEDLQTNLGLFQKDHTPIADHGHLFRNPRIFGFVMKAVFEGCKDWKGLRGRIALQAGLTTCENMMEKIEDYEGDEYRGIEGKFNGLDGALRSIDHLAPLVR